MSKKWKKALLILGFCIPLLTLVVVQVKAGNYFSDYSWSENNTVHPDRVMNKFQLWLCDLVDCSENKWFMGENLKDTGLPYRNVIYTPNLAPMITGADGGVSVRTWENETLIYMGDNFGKPSPRNCEIIKHCNDAIAIVTDVDGPENGVDARVLVDDQNPNKYQPLLIPGIHTSHYLGPSLDEDEFGPFSYPTGIEKGAIIYGDSSNYRVSKLYYLWFATRVASKTPEYGPQSHFTCSLDGIEFGPCPLPVRSPTQPAVRFFSDDKFIIVDPVFFNPDWWDGIDASEECALCKLKPHLSEYWFGYSPSLLLFGAGGGPQNQSAVDGGYRESPLYMAYMELQTLDVWYFAGDGWSASEADAVPVLSYVGKPPAERRKYWFGEISVTLVPRRNANDVYLILLSNHKKQVDVGGRVYYRTAKLVDPDDWSDPQLTCGIGYGPYILDETMGIEWGIPNRLTLYHTIVTWIGPHPPLTVEPYGIFTTQLRLREDPTDPNSPCGEAPIWLGPPYASWRGMHFRFGDR